MKFHPSIIENIAEHAAKTPDKLALADSKIALTYGQLWSRIQGLARKLNLQGVGKGDCVVVECDQSVGYIVCEFAIQLLGGIFVPLEKNSAQSRIDEITADTEAVLHIGKTGFPINSALASPIHTDTTSKDNAAIWQFPNAEDVSEILFSTGTTGKSKGIVLTHGNNMALAENVMYGVKMKPDNVELIPMPLSHSHGLRRTYANLVNGSSVVFSDGVTLLKKVFSLMVQYKVTAIDLSPSMLSIIFKLSKDRLADYADIIDYIQLGSAPLAEEDKIHLSRILPKTRLYNFYGSTEAGCSCLLDFNSMSGKPGCIGRPATNAHFIVVDENRNEIQSSRENPGFLASSGSINMKCYFKAPRLTAETTSDGYIYTKDLGFIDEDGFIYMLGRKDDVINYGGIKISPEEIESIVVKHPNVTDCACVPVHDPLTGQAPKLFLAWEGSEEYDRKKFKTYLTESLDANKQPKYIELIDKIPRTFNGKIKRAQLIEQTS
ncbi:MAG: acyl--CoA ligase [Clostridiales bacterium]|nr:acyl--CoA ligase [Clostridiales bacterium]